MAPSAINFTGGSTPLTIYALRKDGFAGEIALSLRTPRPGPLSGSVPAGQDTASVTLSVPPSFPKDPVNLALEGRATIEASLSFVRSCRGRHDAGFRLPASGSR